MITVVAKNIVKEGKLEEFKALAKILVKETNQKDAGCIKYELYEDTSNPNVLTFIEQWENQGALDKHMAAKHFQEYVPQMGALTEGEEPLGLYKKLY